MAEMEDGLMTRCFVRGAGIAEGTGDMIGEIIGTEESNAHPLFYFVNHRGDTMAAYVQHDTTKTLAAEYRYDAFGNVTSSTTNEPSFLPRFTFSTKEYLAEAQLYLYAYRVYDPVAGRWTQREPVNYQDSANLYQFCGNNPVALCDIDGRGFSLLRGLFCATPIGFILSITLCTCTFAEIAEHNQAELDNPTVHNDGTITETYEIVYGQDYPPSLRLAQWGLNYRRLSPIARSIMYEHAKIHKELPAGDNGELPAYRDTYRRASELLALRTDLTKKETSDLKKILTAATGYLKSNMTKDDYDTFTKGVSTETEKKRQKTN